MANKIDILENNWIEQVFKDRNKSYGAYFLRKIYSHHITRGAIISLAIFTIGASAPKIYDWITGMTGAF
ncbi:MAG TPA: hypothetical protein PLO59_05845, partial [Bacteroidia bacterium]|nr:hypothetical protein [Bacteroidia bacterium]